MRGNMIRHIATVMRGTVLVQALGLLALPLLTRLYSPTEFGHYQLYQSASTLLVVFVSLRFEVGLLRAQDGRELNATLALCLLSTVAVTLALALAWAAAVVLYPSLYARIPVSPMLVILAVFLIGTFQLLGFLVTREQLYSVSANSKVVQAVSYASIASALGAVSASAGLIIADALARLCGSLYLICRLRSRGIYSILHVHAREIKAAAWKFREFPLISVFGGMVNSLGAIITPVMIYAKFSPEVSGQFALLERSLSLPVAMVVTAVSQVYTATFSRLIRSDPSQLRKHFHDLLRMLALTAVGPAVIAFFIAPSLFALVFGSHWQLAGELAQIMVPAYLAVFIYGGVNMTIMLLGRQVLQISWEVLRLACMVLLWAVIVHPGMSVKTVVTLHALLLCGMSLLFIGIAEYSVRRGPTKAAVNYV